MWNRNPFLGAPPREVPLANSPLERVLAQVRFPAIPKIGDRHFIADFHNEIRHRYSGIREETGYEINFHAQGGGFTQKTVWRMSDRTQKWRVSLGENFLSLETSEYPGRSNFILEYEQVLSKLNSTIHPEYLDRIGLRYINRIPFDSAAELSELIDASVMGVIGPEIEALCENSISEVVFHPQNDKYVKGRWGLLPPGETYDPTILSPQESKNWIIDIDGFRSGQYDCNAQHVSGVLADLAESDYRVFRAVVTPELLRNCGGEL